MSFLQTRIPLSTTSAPSSRSQVWSCISMMLTLVLLRASGGCGGVVVVLVIVFVVVHLQWW